MLRLAEKPFGLFVDFNAAFLRCVMVLFSVVLRISTPSRLLAALFMACFVAVPAFGQELNCGVQIDDSQLNRAGSDLAFLDNLEQKIQEYLNDRSWTEEQFLRHERISCSMQIVLLEAISISEFRARLIVTTRRPIYGTSQSSIVARINDPEWRFEHTRGASLQHNLERYDPLTSVLDFYAYVILGYDYDTFSSLGGTEYFEQARTIADRAEGNGDPGWSSVGTTQNRVRLLSNLIDQRHEPLRQVYYEYHRKGLDRFVRETDAARQAVLEALNTLQELNERLSRSFALNLFFSAKYEELTALFSGSEMESQAHSLLVQMDPSHSSEYDALVE